MFMHDKQLKKPSFYKIQKKNTQKKNPKINHALQKKLENMFL